MRSTLLALACLSTFAMAQNVLAIAPADLAENGVRAVPVEAAAEFVSSAGLGQAEVPRPGTLSLFVAGLAGLTVAGGRRHERPERAPADR